MQVATTKGTGGDVLILEEAAYCDEGFFYETVAPLLSVGRSSLVAISTLTSSINFYTRLMKLIDPLSNKPLFTIREVQLVCQSCQEEGKVEECPHLLHLVPRWQSAERHRKLRIIMQDRPDLIRSELAGLSFDCLTQVFRKADIENLMTLKPLEPPLDSIVFVAIDPAAGGAFSNYALVSMVRFRGNVVVSASERK